MKSSLLALKERELDERNLEELETLKKDVKILEAECQRQKVCI